MVIGWLHRKPKKELESAEKAEKVELANHEASPVGFKDITLTCCECGREFEWEVGEQRYFRDKNLLPPRRCPEHRARRRELARQRGAAW